MTDKITVENVNMPGHSSRVDRKKYEAVRDAMMALLPNREPGFTHKEIMAALPAHLPQALFPGGAKRGWWSKTVQLDLEAKGLLVRENTRPLRWHRKARSG